MPADRNRPTFICGPCVGGMHSDVYWKTEGDGFVHHVCLDCMEKWEVSEIQLIDDPSLEPAADWQNQDSDFVARVLAGCLAEGTPDDVVSTAILQLLTRYIMVRKDSWDQGFVAVHPDENPYRDH